MLKRDGYLDQMELRNGRRVEADTVHHIFPADVYPQYKYCAWNLISLTFGNHEAMHNRIMGTLSSAGRKLMMELSEQRGIPINTLTLVIGLSGSGKSTWVKHHLGDGLAYDLDYISSAFRLSAPHAEYHEQSRRLAGQMVKGFAMNARQMSSRVFVIRSAPTIEEVQEIEPDRIVVMTSQYDVSNRKDYRKQDTEAQKERIRECIEYANANSIEILMQ